MLYQLACPFCLLTIFLSTTALSVPATRNLTDSGSAGSNTTDTAGSYTVLPTGIRCDKRVSRKFNPSACAPTFRSLGAMREANTPLTWYGYDTPEWWGDGACQVTVDVVGETEEAKGLVPDSVNDTFSFTELVEVGVSASVCFGSSCLESSMILST